MTGVAWYLALSIEPCCAEKYGDSDPMCSNGRNRSKWGNAVWIASTPRVGDGAGFHSSTSEAGAPVAYDPG